MVSLVLSPVILDLRLELKDQGGFCLVLGYCLVSEKVLVYKAFKERQKLAIS